MMQAISIGDALFTKTQQKVLGLLFGHPHKSFYMNEIMRLANMGRGTITRELVRMQAAGLLTVSRIGNQNHYQANPDCPVYVELLGIVRKTFGIADVLRLALEPALDNVDVAFVYGSIAKGTERAKSDIDLMIIGEGLNYTELMELLMPAEEVLGRTINPVVYTMDDFRDKIRQKNSFILRVKEQPKIMLKGSMDDIGQS